MDEINTSQDSSTLRLFRSLIPSKELLFFTQVLVIFIVIIACLINLSLGQGDDTLWKYLMCNIIGIILPNPTLNVKKHE